mmetsp:Transcript_147231/g.257192  ORF Transcript_147231/g.257192 Transcript_147231/m.257192 type:complete len:346 (+) Transcript_147231:599-1636(+)
MCPVHHCSHIRGRGGLAYRHRAGLHPPAQSGDPGKDHCDPYRGAGHPVQSPLPPARRPSGRPRVVLRGHPRGGGRRPAGRVRPAGGRARPGVDPRPDPARSPHCPHHAGRGAAPPGAPSGGGPGRPPRPGPPVDPGGGRAVPAPALRGRRGGRAGAAAVPGAAVRGRERRGARGRGLGGPGPRSAPSPDAGGSAGGPHPEGVCRGWPRCGPDPLRGPRCPLRLRVRTCPPVPAPPADPPPGGPCDGRPRPLPRPRGPGGRACLRPEGPACRGGPASLLGTGVCGGGMRTADGRARCEGRGGGCRGGGCRGAGPGGSQGRSRECASRRCDVRRLLLRPGREGLAIL